MGTCSTRRWNAGARFGVLVIVQQGALPPEATVRKALARVFADRASVISGAAIVFEWVRVQASMVRGVVTGLALLSRFQYPYRVFDNARSATARLASMDKSLDADRARMLDAIDAAVAE